MNRHKAFTLTEIVIVIAILSLITLVVATSFSEFLDQQRLNAAAEGVTSIIQEAREFTLSSKDSTGSGAIYGIRVNDRDAVSDPNQIIRFKTDFDSSCSPLTDDCVVFTMPSRIEISDIFLSPTPIVGMGTVDEFTYERITGDVSVDEDGLDPLERLQTGVITLRSQSSNKIIFVHITPTGVLEIQEELIEGGGSGAPPGAVAEYSFHNAPESSVVINDTGNATYNGLLGPSRWQEPNWIGGAYDFTVPGDHIRINGLFGNQPNLTITAWMRAKGEVDNDTIISLGDRVALRINVPAGGYLEGFFKYSGGTKTTTYTQDVRNNLIHVAYVIDDANNIQKLFVDGQEVIQTTSLNSISYSGGTNTYIGIRGNGDTGAERFWGIIKELRFYDRALTNSEIMDDMNTPVVPL